jgi:isopentenyl-diphosphate delta-isomerase type 1
MSGEFRPANLDELFDVVDREDRVIGRAPRREVHAQNLLHRAAHVIVHDAQGRVFLQRRSLAKDSFPGCWDDSCTGHLDAGEDYATAARRELGEELGWHDASLPLRPVVKLSASAETGHEFIEIFLLGPVAGPFTLHPGEISEGRWIAPAEVIAEMEHAPENFAGGMRLLWTRHRGAIIRGLKTVSS